MLVPNVIFRACVFRSMRFSHTWRSKGTQSSGNGSPLRRLLDDPSGFGEAAPAHRQQQWSTVHVDPQESSVLLFPGQGVQSVGMGRDLLKYPAAKDLYDLASSIVGWDVRKVCTEGPAAELDERCQTAILVTSLAALERAHKLRPAALQHVRAVIGFSLGEFTALVFAGALPFEGTLKLLEVRNAAMNAEYEKRQGGGLSVWLEPDADLELAMQRASEHATERGVPGAVCQVAVYLPPGRKVVAGDIEALKFIEKNGSKFGIKRADRLRVKGANHTPLLAAAETAVREALCAMPVRAPRLRVVSTVDSCAYGDADSVRHKLARHMTHATRCEQALHEVYARPRGEPLPPTLTFGPSEAMATVLRRFDAKAWENSLHIDT
ncbi:hypothetical protein ABMA28_015044 [Loxostege sticticalis]|uniref:Malonyl-CoA:ACP transacylase (MAT) domain-containing protein n=1 Tax=Loxostege sticticalis TaxID=481309 RepID=A0ABD0TE43_LOXSC